MAAFLEIADVSKGFGEGADRHPVLDRVNLSVERGEFVAVVGCSGSGKTTLLSLIAGLVRADSGIMRLDGKEISGPGTDRAVVFQQYSLLPWMTVAANIRLAVDQLYPHWTASERDEHVRRTIALVNLSAAHDKYPHQLSGGMKQRVAVARALAMNPEVLLLDEPFGALDALTRATLQGELERICADGRKTVVMITNDVDEAILLADRIVALTDRRTLAEPIVVRVARPRRRAMLDHDPELKRLRIEVAARLRHAAPGELSSAMPAGQGVGIAGIARPRAPADARSGMPAPGFLELRQVGKSYDTPRGTQVVVDGIDLDCREGEFVSIVGHSGCGKTTVMSMIAGLVTPDRGEIVLAGERVTSPGPERAMVFQSPSLLPWLSALENVLLGVDQAYRSASRAERRAIATHYLERVGLAGALDKKPGDLSAGMRQRVGVARAFALSPKMLLLDEPFGSLDSVTRSELQDVLLELWESTRSLAVMVTHDIDEALYLSDRIVLMTDGPAAVIGEIIDVPFARPRHRRALEDHPDHHALRARIIDFLQHHATPSGHREAAPVRMRAATA